MLNVDVVEGDIVDIDLSEGSFDLIHARLVLTHNPERRRALERSRDALRPGGYAVLEELDWMALLTDPDPDRIAIFRAFHDALPTLEFECGRALLRELDQAGLIDTTADFRVDLVEGAIPDYRGHGWARFGSGGDQPPPRILLVKPWILSLWSPGIWSWCGRSAHPGSAVTSAPPSGRIPRSSSGGSTDPHLAAGQESLRWARRTAVS